MAKGKLKKIIKIVLVAILVLILAVALVFKLYGNELIRSGIVSGSQKALQVGVQLESIDLKLVGGTVDLRNMVIDNPEGYKHPTFLKLGRAYVDLNVPSLMSDTIEMEKIQLDNIHLTIEQKGKTNNLKEILNNLPKSEPAEPKPESKPQKEGAGKNVRIKVLEINNIEVKAKLLPIPCRADTVTLQVKPIRMENIGSKNKVDSSELTARIIKAIAKGVTEQGAELLPDDMLNSVSDELAKQGVALQKAGKDLLDSSKDIGKEATDAIKGLGDMFKKKEEK